MDLSTYDKIRDYIRTGKKFAYTDLSSVPEKRGIYFMFEEGQIDNDGGKRIVRIGKATNLYKRLKGHFDNGSVFRRHVESALKSTNKPATKQAVSKHIQDNITFSIVRIPQIISCDELEMILIAMLAFYSKDLTLSDWLGLNCDSENVKNFKIWDDQVYQKIQSQNLKLNEYLQDLIEIGLVK